ncbi:MAG: type II secretion system protein [Helicobacter sp.]|nr:type II secretion system protein [Helicobacter sp.]
MLITQKSKFQKRATKGAFTMLELVFILVILGILAAIAIPKISASREDAKIVVFKNDINALKSSLPAYFLSQGKGDFKSALELSATNWNITEFQITSTLESAQKTPCVTARLLSDENGTQATTQESVRYLEISTQSISNPNGDTCEKLIAQSGFDNNLLQIIPLLSSSIVF